MDFQNGHVLTLANSIIGVSVLAMPYCFKQCGIVLSIFMLLISSIISRLACHFLLKSAIIARRRTFEFLAYYIFGAMGKFAIEIGIIGFLIGTCIAFFVVMGDLGPEIVAEVTGSYTTDTMRTSILMALALFCVLPLGLLRNVDSLNGVSKATIGFYCCLVLRIVFEGFPHIFSGGWYHRVNFWRPEGILQCLPIFTMALFCQTQLFEIYQVLQNATLERMNNLVRVAVNICTWVYIFVGVFGYIAFFQKPFTGNILLTFPPSFMTDVMKIGFILSVAFSFPLVIFPCRASLYSLLYKEGHPLHEGMSTYIPESRFKGLTFFIVFISLIIGIMIPNIELVLGLVGSTIGVMICVLFPVTCFICISPKNTNERILAQIMLMVGVFVMVLGTYKNLYSLDNLEANTVTISNLKNLEQIDLNVAKAIDKINIEKNAMEKALTTARLPNIEKKINIERSTTMRMIKNEEIREIRHEPPQPVEPVEDVQVNNVLELKQNEQSNAVNGMPQEDNKVIEEKAPQLPVKLPDTANKVLNESRNDEVDIEAIKKEDTEVEQQEKEKTKEEETNRLLIDAIQKQNQVQMEMVEQHKKINEEKVKAMKNIQNLALVALEKVSGGENDDKIVADLEKRIKENVEKKLEENKESAPLEQIVKVEPDSLKNDINEKTVPENPKQKENIPIEVGPDSLVIEERHKPDTLTLNNIQSANKIKSEVQNDQIKIKNFPGNIIQNEDQKHNKPLGIKDNNNNAKENGIIKDIVTVKPQDTKSKFSTEKHIVPEAAIKNVSPLTSQINNNVNNTAPLFLKLGKSEVKDNDNVHKMMPLPLIMSGNIPNNLSNSESSVAPKGDSNLNEKKDSQHDKDESKVLRSDIL